MITADPKLRREMLSGRAYDCQLLLVLLLIPLLVLTSLSFVDLRKLD